MPSHPDHQLAARALSAFGLLLAYLVFSPLLMPLGFPISNAVISLMDWQRILELVTLGLVILWLAPAVIVGDYAGLNLPGWGESASWLIIFALGVVSCAYAAMPMVALLDWSWTLCWFVATALLVALAPGSKSALYESVAVWTITVLASYTLLFYVSNADALFEPLSFLSVRFPGFNNVRPFADYQTVVLFFIPAAINKLVTSDRWRSVCWLLAGMYVALAFMSGSRSLILGQLAGLTSISLLLRRRSTQFLGRQLKMWLFGAASYALLFVLFPLLVRGSISTLDPEFVLLRFGVSERDVIWKLAISMFLDSPLLGVGPMHFAAFMNPVAASPHNHVLQLLAEWGGPATAIFVVIAGRFLWRGVGAVSQLDEVRPGSDAEFQVAATAALVALLAQSFVSPVFNNPASQILLSLLAILCSSRGGGTGARGVKMIALAAMAALILGTWLVAPWIGRIAERNSCYVFSTEKPTGRFAPRFWQQGWIFPPCEPR